MFTVKKVLVVGTLLVAGCASTPTAQLSSGNPNEALIEVEGIRDSGRENQIDLLADIPFRKGETSLEEAREGLKNTDNKENILRSLSESKAYFLEAKKVANFRDVVPDGILNARKASLESGVRESPDLVRKLEDIDESLRDKTADFSKSLPVESFSKLEKEYLDLETESVQNAELMTFRDIVQDAENNRAPTIAKKTYRNAKTDLRAAENMIRQSPRNPENYRDSVLKDDKSSKLLADVMNKLKGVAKGASEEAALAMVYQERKLGVLSDRTTTLEGSLSRSDKDLNAMVGELRTKSREARNDANKVRLQEAMDKVRSNFSNEEAEVYQQGDSLIIRLKQVDFKSGSAMIPSKSMGLLSKVNSIIEPLTPDNVVIQGHTDSVGKSSTNQTLSIKRSEAVAQYFKSLRAPYQITSSGFGESKPITSNDTRQGRAMNRRVDIVVNTTKAM